MSVAPSFLRQAWTSFMGADTGAPYLQFEVSCDAWATAGSGTADSWQHTSVTVEEMPEVSSSGRVPWRFAVPTVSGVRKMNSQRALLDFFGWPATVQSVKDSQLGKGLRVGGDSAKSLPRFMASSCHNLPTRF